MSKIVIASGTGFLGKVLLAYFRPKVDTIVVLTRQSIPDQGNVKFVRWDAKTLGPWVAQLEASDAIINLCGKSVNCRYTKKNREAILSSRIDSTLVLGKAIQTLEKPPTHWVNSSTATIYEHSLEKQNDEATGQIGDDFSMGVAKKWESAFFNCDTPNTLKTAIRIAIVLGRDGGAFIPLRRLCLLGLGGSQGSGRQKVSWIHEQDFARAVAFILDQRMEGPVNLAAPQPSDNASLMKTIRKSLGRPFGLPATAAMIKFGSRIIGTEAELVLKSRNVVPKRLLEAGFLHRFVDLGIAMDELNNR